LGRQGLWFLPSRLFQRDESDSEKTLLLIGGTLSPGFGITGMFLLRRIKKGGGVSLPVILFHTCET
jgi:hypothetical protein